MSDHLEFVMRDEDMAGDSPGYCHIGLVTSILSNGDVGVMLRCTPEHVPGAEFDVLGLSLEDGRLQLRLYNIDPEGGYFFHSDTTEHGHVFVAPLKGPKGAPK